MKVVARRTSLTPHVIRVWEKRYGAVTPTRTTNNRRLYSQADIERLRLLRQATEAGHNISQVASLPTEALLALTATSESTQVSQTNGSDSTTPYPQAYLDECMTAIRQLDAEGLEAIFNRAVVALGRPALIEQVIAPLMQQIGELWREGTLRVAHEHLAWAVVRTFLGNTGTAYAAPSTAPNLIVTTPVRQLHELGALIAVATAVSEGWRVTYLGPSLPAEEIAAVAQQSQSRAVALSIVHPPDDPHLGDELKKLRQYLTEDVVLIAGGRVADAYKDVLSDIGAIRTNDLAEFRNLLESLRSQQPP